jgi:phage gpG-like protein
LIRFTGDIDGEQVFDRAFNRIDRAVSDFRSIWPEVSGIIYRIFGKAFETEGASTAAGKFQALTPAYAKQKAIEFPGQTILKAENTLFESMTNPDALDAVFIPEPTQLTIGSRDPKARAHQRGLGNLPARPFISFTEPDKREIQKSLQRGLLQFVRSLGIDVREEKAA